MDHLWNYSGPTTEGKTGMGMDSRRSLPPRRRGRERQGVGYTLRADSFITAAASFTMRSTTSFTCGVSWMMPVI